MMLMCAVMMAQAPQKMTYQAVVRGSDNALVANQNVSVRISILQGSIYGASVYVETHSAATNANGLLTIEVGGGSVLNGSLQDVDWSNGPFYLKSQIDPNGGVSYSIESIQQLLSVPYALYVASAGNVPAFAMTPTDTGYVMVLTMPDGTVQSYVLRHGQEGPQGLPALQVLQVPRVHKVLPALRVQRAPRVLKVNRVLRVLLALQVLMALMARMVRTASHL